MVLRICFKSLKSPLTICNLLHCFIFSSPPCDISSRSYEALRIERANQPIFEIPFSSYPYADKLFSTSLKEVCGDFKMFAFLLGLRMSLKGHTIVHKL